MQPPLFPGFSPFSFHVSQVLDYFLLLAFEETEHATTKPFASGNFSRCNGYSIRNIQGYFSDKNLKDMQLHRTHLFTRTSKAVSKEFLYFVNYINFEFGGNYFEVANV